MSTNSQSDPHQYAWGFVVDEVFRLVPDKITAGSALKGVLPIVQGLITGDWDAETRLEIQGQIHKVLRAMKLLPEV